MRARRARPNSWVPARPVPWPDLADPHLALLRAAIEARLFPYGDLVSSPGRCIARHQLDLLARGRVEGMTDQEAAAFLSANLMGGANPVYRRGPSGPEWVGTVVLAGRYGPRDVMGRSDFYWHLTVTPRPGRFPVDASAVWVAGAALAALRGAFRIPVRAILPGAENVAGWDDDQALLF